MADRKINFYISSAWDALAKTYDRIEDLGALDHIYLDISNTGYERKKYVKEQSKAQRGNFSMAFRQFEAAKKDIMDEFNK
jgi:hypothetical protein